MTSHFHGMLKYFLIWLVLQQKGQITVQNFFNEITQPSLNLGLLEAEGQGGGRAHVPTPSVFVNQGGRLCQPHNYTQGRKWLPNTGWASSNVARGGVPPPPGGAFYSTKIWVGNCPPCPPATYAPEFEINLCCFEHFFMKFYYILIVLHYKMLKTLFQYSSSFRQKEP